jgi:hypothetical protein
MIQDFLNTANETSPGGLQLVVAVDGAVQHWTRGPDESAEWKMAEAVGAGVKHVWGLVQGSFGGMMHMITEGTDGLFSYWELSGRWKLIEVLKALDNEDWDVIGEVSGG